MPDIIPESLQSLLSPLIVRASSWPEPDSLTRPKDEREEAENPESIVEDPAKKAALLDAVGLVHGALRNEKAGERIHWNAQKDLFYKLYYKAPEEPPPDGDKYEAWKKWSGWASWSLIQGQIRAFTIWARHEEKREEIDLDALKELIGDVLTNRLRDEFMGDSVKHTASPQVKGPEHFACITALDMSGYGVEYPNLYSYTNGQDVLLVFQIIAHGTAPEGISGP